MPARPGLRANTYADPGWLTHHDVGTKMPWPLCAWVLSLYPRFKLAWGRRPIYASWGRNTNEPPTRIARAWNHMSRADAIRQRLIDHISGAHSAPMPRALADWDPNVDHLHTPFGYARPAWTNGITIIAFCPELIDQTTTDLSEQDLKDYLTCIEVQLDYYRAHNTMTDEEATEWFDRYVASQSIRSMVLMNRVQMAWLDRRATA